MTAAEAATQTLADWLSDRLDEDEAVARVASPGPWNVLAEVPRVGTGVVRTDTSGTRPSLDGVAISETPADAAHIARHDPARVLTEVAAKKRVVGELKRWEGWSEGLDRRAALNMLFPVVKYLASVYADHEGYRDEWRL